MKNPLRSTLKAAATVALIAASAAMQAQDNDCGFTYTLDQGCNPNGTGWAVVTDVQGTDWPVSVHWDYNEVAGGNQQTSLSNGEYTVTVFDITGCDVTVTFTIDCAPQEEDENCQFRTQTQGGWGSNPNGNNPGAYLAANFAGAFPNGLLIGCDNELRLTSAAAVRAFLPSGTTARALPAGTLTDPGNSYRNVLAGQLVALSLSLGFDAYDPDFGESNNSLANAVFQHGTFQGWRVFEVLDEANRFIGGCSSLFTASQLNKALSMANENYVDGSTDGGALGCNLAERPRLAGNPSLTVKLYDVPAGHHLDLAIITEAEGPVTIQLHDAMGRAVGSMRTIGPVVGNETRINMDLSGLSPGNYLVLCQQGEHRATQRFPVGQ